MESLPKIISRLTTSEMTEQRIFCCYFEPIYGFQHLFNVLMWNSPNASLVTT
jgi:hypothetical protein